MIVLVLKLISDADGPMNGLEPAVKQQRWHCMMVPALRLAAENSWPNESACVRIKQQRRHDGEQCCLIQGRLRV
jgi:hypothetical protein